MAERKKPLLIQAVEIDEHGNEKHITVNADDLHSPEMPVHQTLNEEQTRRSRAVYALVGEYLRGAYPTEAEFTDTFRSERNPTREIEAYEAICTRLEWAIGRFKATTFEQRQVLFNALLLLSFGAVDVSSQTGLPDRMVEELQVGPNRA